MPLPNHPDPTQQPAPASSDERPLILDTHADTAQRFADEAWSFSDPLQGGHLNLASARIGNLAGEFFAIWPEPTQWRGRYAHRTLQLIDSILEQVRRAPGQLQLCTSADEILAARAGGRFAVLMGIEGGHAIENSLALLRTYFHLGVRYMTLTWANSNDWATSSGDLDAPSGRHHGLSQFGHDVIREMNRLGMIVDVSHSSDATLADVLAASRAPILATHSSARALTNSPRNLTDDQLRAIAAAGGAIMVNFYSAFISETYCQTLNALKPERDLAHQVLVDEYAVRCEPIPYRLSNEIDRQFASRIPRPPLSALIDHIDHIAQTAGVDCVGIGTDFDGISALPEGIGSTADLPRVFEALRSRGYTPVELQKISGGNLLRVFREVASAA